LIDGSQRVDSHHGLRVRARCPPVKRLAIPDTRKPNDIQNPASMRGNGRTLNGRTGRAACGRLGRLQIGGNIQLDKAGGRQLDTVAGRPPRDHDWRL